MNSELETLGIAKLESSGLTLDDAMELGIEFLPGESVPLLYRKFSPVPSLKLPYWDPTNLLLPLSPAPMWPAFYRLRYLKTPTTFDAIALKKPPRYVQEPNSGVCAYFPRNVDWPSLIANPNAPLMVTEGEFKAAKACKEGFPTIGLGGVYNFRSAQMGVSFLRELEQVQWVKRYVYICFDSDYRKNPNITTAMNELAEQLYLRGALVFLTPLPDVVEGENTKTGLDDFLIHRSAEELHQLLGQGSYTLTQAQAMWKMNKRVTYVANPGIIINNATGQKMSPSFFKDHVFSAVDTTENVVSPTGTISMRSVATSANWLKWPLRNEVDHLTYSPGREKIINDGYNTWPGWGVQPKKGDVSYFLALVDHIFKGASAEAKQWFLWWCAYPLQFPGVKMFSSVVIHGLVHGSGKSLVGYSLGRIYGKNFTEIKQEDLHAEFNEWAENKQFILGDDVTGSDKRQDADLLKKMITQRELRINAKFISTYVIPDCINYMWTSNQPDAFFLEDNDRRFFIHEVTAGVLPEMFYADYDIWLDTDGASALFDYLLNLDLGDFNPAAPALRTAAKERMTDDVRSDLGSWVRMLIKNPDGVLRVGDVPMLGDLFTNRQLLRIYDPSERTRTTANGLGRELRRAGVPQVLEGMPILTKDGQDRYYVLRNRDKWAKSTAVQVREHLAAIENGTLGKRRKF